MPNGTTSTTTVKSGYVNGSDMLLYIGEKAESFAEGVKLAAEIIDSGKAMETLEKLIAISNDKEA